MSKCNFTEQEDTFCGEGSMEIQPSSMDIAIMILFIFTLTLTIIGNITVVVIFLRCRRLRTATNSFLVNVAVADILTGCVSVPLSLVTYTMPSKVNASETTCLWSVSLMMLTIGVSVSFLMWANLDRFIAIHLPFKYSKIFCRKTVVVVTVGSWVFFSAFSFSPAMGFHAAVIDSQCDLMIVLHPVLCAIVITVYSGMMIVLVFMNIKIYCTARRHSRCIRIQASFSRRLQKKHIIDTNAVATPTGSGSQESVDDRRQTNSQTDTAMRGCNLKRNSRSIISLLTNSNSGSTLGSPNRSQNGKMRNFQLVEQKARMHFIPNWKALKVVTVVVITYTICHFPTAFILMLQFVAKMEGYNYRIYHEPFVLAIALTYLNSAMNPFIYYRIIPPFRRQIKRLLCCQQKYGDQEAYSTSYRRNTLDDIGQAE